MKNFYKISVTLTVLSFMTILSCEDKVEINNEVAPEEYIEVGVSAYWPEVTESPLAKAGTSSDLYGIEVYEATYLDDENLKYDGKVYASGVFDNLDTKIKLIKNKTYYLGIVYIPNGKNLIQPVGKGYGMPFGHIGNGQPPVFGKFTYGGNCSMNAGGYGNAQKKGQTDDRIQANWGNSIEIYYGGQTVKSDKDIELSVNLYRQMFGLNVNVENLSRGKVHVCLGFPYEQVKSANGYIYTATVDSPSIDKVIELPYMPWKDMARFPLRDSQGNYLEYYPYTDDYYKNWRVEGGFLLEFIKVYYESEEGDLISLFEINLDLLKRMTKLTISFDINEYLDDYQGSIKANVIDDSEWENEDISDTRE